MFVILFMSFTCGACRSTASEVAYRSPASPSTTTYSKLSGNLTSRLCRAALKSNPLTSKRAFYGNYGGPGDYGGVPIDFMDELFFQHDLCYCESRSLRRMIDGDKALVSALKAIDPDTLDDDARAYRKRAIAFFRSPFSRIVGKPLLSAFRGSKHENLNRSATSQSSRLGLTLLSPTRQTP